MAVATSPGAPFPRGGILAVRSVLVLAGLGSVASLLAWVYGFGSFRTWFLLTGAPSVALLLVLGGAAARAHPSAPLAGVGAGVAAGVLGGALGTAGYDLFRVPFTVAGYRVLAPIDSYGVLLLGAGTSSPLSGLAGWAYHAANGIGFGVSYGLVARGRHWAWGLAWAMALETATIVTPFFDSYHLRGQTASIIIAYAAHVAYGVPLGLVVRAAGRWPSGRDAVVRPGAVVAVVVAALVLWHQPWTTSAARRAASDLRPQPAAVIRRGRFTPEWLRVAPGACATIRNDDPAPVPVQGPDGEVVVEPGAMATLCGRTAGVLRVRAAAKPFGGGFLLVDDQERPAVGGGSLRTRNDS